MLYISIFCIFCRFFCLLTIKNLLSQKKTYVLCILARCELYSGCYQLFLPLSFEASIGFLVIEFIEASFISLQNMLIEYNHHPPPP